MDFQLDQEQQQFQDEVASFIERGLPAGWDQEHDSLDERVQVEKKVMKALAERRWLALPWPEEYGGAGASPIEQLIFNEQMAYHGVPGSVNMGVAWVGPVIMLYGTDDQKQRFLSRIADGTDIWCTLYSEPGSGSDLASMQTRAVRDGDEYVINGQKIWTSLGHFADWGWLAARTDPDAPKHKGLSTFAVDMNTPGITIQPLVNMAGSHEFNEVFFEDVRIPAQNLVGEENRGWYHVAVGLDFERSSIGASSNARRTLDELIAAASRQRGAVSDVLRHRLAEHTIEVTVLRQMSYNIAWMQEKTDIAPTKEAQMAKLFGAELQQRIANTGMALYGMQGQAYPADEEAFDRNRYRYLRAVANTIEGGTSEIQRTVIASRGLGLPRE